MKELIECVYKRISEGSLAKQYLRDGRISKDIIDQLREIDPTEQKKYLDWMVKVYAKGIDRNLEHFGVVRDFDRLVKKNIITKKDINAYKSPEELYDVVKHYGGTKTKTEVKSEIKKKGAELVFENDKVRIYKIKDEDASRYYGAGTKWCTAASKSYNYFNDYYYKHCVNLYYILLKNLDEKYAVAVYPGGELEVYDEEDRKMDPAQYRSLFKKLGIPF